MRAQHWLALVGAVAVPLTVLPAAAWGDAPPGAPSPMTAAPASGDYGAVVEGLVAQYDRALQRESLVQAELHAAQARLAADRYVEAQAVSSLRAVVLDAYVDGSFGASQMPTFSPPVSDAQIAQGEYQTVASSRLRGVIDLVRRDEARTQSAASQLSSALAEASSSTGELTQARGAAQAAVQYLNPLRDLARLSPSRVDQGVDYTGYGPVYALGDGTVLSTTCSGWPGGSFIAYRLTDGRAAGLVAYVAEDVEPLVAVGDAVTSATALGTMYEGPTGIETGWADPSADGMTMAGDARQLSGSNATAFGANFSDLLASLGAPRGLSSGPAAGTLPPDWPAW